LNGDGKAPVSTHDLIAPDAAFLIITDESGADWVEAANKIAKQSGVRISTAVISDSNRKGTLRDREERWGKLKGIKEGGAILVRPDNFVAARWMKRSNEPAKEIANAVTSLLGRSNGDLERVNSHSGTNSTTVTV
jgi:2,4-dichlorophenol 6-monooxygenase